MSSRKYLVPPVILSAMLARFLILNQLIVTACDKLSRICWISSNLDLLYIVHDLSKCTNLPSDNHFAKVGLWYFSTFCPDPSDCCWGCPTWFIRCISYSFTSCSFSCAGVLYSTSSLPKSQTTMEFSNNTGAMAIVSLSPPCFCYWGSKRNLNNKRHPLSIAWFRHSE